MESNSSRFEEAESFLYALRNAGSKYSLDRIAALCAALGNPQCDYPKIHVAGTNGKGSVCAMLERILRGGGLRVGMFTSPHLTYLGERIQTDRVPVSRSKLVEYAAELRRIANGIFDPADIGAYPSFFEFMTATAFAEFSRGRVDCAVVEVGLGGRLDSTNIILPELSVITSIGLDHIQMLGSTVGQIAREKAGIIKDGVPVVCGFLPVEAMAVIGEIAASRNAPIYRAADFFPNDADLPETSLYGYFQRRNAATALLCLRVLRGRAAAGKSSPIFENLSEAAARRDLLDVSWAARWQKIPLANGATLILDASHNEEGARTLESNLASLGGVRPTIAVGVLGEERAVPLLKVVAKYARRIILLVPDQPRALGFGALRKCLGECSVEVLEARVGDVFKAGNVCDFVGAGETIVSTGSIYLAGEVLAALGGGKPDNLQDIPYK